MRPVNFTGGNMRLLPPPNVKPGEVDPVIAYRPPSLDRMVTVWVPSAEEIAALQGGAHILLHIFGQLHPPISLSVQTMVEREGAVHGIVGDGSQTPCGLQLPEQLPKDHVWAATKEWVTCPTCKEKS